MLIIGHIDFVLTMHISNVHVC